ncbi:hypothetical protein D3C87_1135520 [compost metagenome]
MPFADLQQFGGEDARQGQRQLGKAQAQHHALQAVPRGKRLQGVVQAQHPKRAAHHAIRGPHGDRRRQGIRVQVGERHQRIQHQERFRKQAQAELLAELHQQQIHGNDGHHVGGRQPLHLVGIGGQRTLQVQQIGRHQAVAQSPRQRDDQADDEIRDTLGRRMFGHRWRPGQGRAFARPPGARCVLVHAVIAIRFAEAVLCCCYTDGGK